VSYWTEEDTRMADEQLTDAAETETVEPAKKPRRLTKKKVHPIAPKGVGGVYISNGDGTRRLAD